MTRPRLRVQIVESHLNSKCKNLAELRTELTKTTRQQDTSLSYMKQKKKHVYRSSNTAMTHVIIRQDE